MDQEKLMEQYRRMVPALRRMALRRLDSPQDAEDALQNAFLRAWEHRAQLRDETCFAGWMVRILLREAANVRRNRRAWLPLETVPEPDDGSGEEQWLTRMALREICGGLRGVSGRCFRLYYLQGCTVREIAGKLGVSESTVRVYLHRMRRKIREKERPARLS